MSNAGARRPWGHPRRHGHRREGPEAAADRRSSGDYTPSTASSSHRRGRGAPTWYPAGLRRRVVRRRGPPLRPGARGRIARSRIVVVGEFLLPLGVGSMSPCRVYLAARFEELSGCCFSISRPPVGVGGSAVCIRPTASMGFIGSHGKSLHHRAGVRRQLLPLARSTSGSQSRFWRGAGRLDL